MTSASKQLAAGATKASKRAILDGISEGRPRQGPTTVHIDVTNACNAACITCWDHSPLLNEGRPSAWKMRKLALKHFRKIINQFVDMGCVQSIILSGMGDPLVHPDIYRMIALVKRQGWHLTVLTNLLAADIDKLEQSGVDQLLVGVHGARPASYLAFHSGWTNKHFSTLCRYLRRLHAAGIRCRHVQVINHNNASDVPEMVRFGKSFGAARVNYKLASLYGGTEACGITAAQRLWLLQQGVPQARVMAEQLGVSTNLNLFEQQLHAAEQQALATTPIETIGCFMGYVYTRITVDREVLFCCNTAVRVGSLRDHSFQQLWYGRRWQALRDEVRRGRYFRGCDKCGKFEQNVKWSKRYRAHAGDTAWKQATGQLTVNVDAAHAAPVPETTPPLAAAAGRKRLRVLA